MMKKMLIVNNDDILIGSIIAVELIKLIIVMIAHILEYKLKN